MFDTVFIHASLLPLPEEEQQQFKNYRGWQTKDLGANHEAIRIEPPGIFWAMPYNMVDLIPILYTGEFEFYTVTPDEKRYRFWVEFEGGIMSNIIHILQPNH